MDHVAIIKSTCLLLQPPRTRKFAAVQAGYVSSGVNPNAAGTRIRQMPHLPVRQPFGGCDAAKTMLVVTRQTVARANVERAVLDLLQSIDGILHQFGRVKVIE